jgi:hypothetical protein
MVLPWSSAAANPCKPVGKRDMPWTLHVYQSRHDLPWFVGPHHPYAAAEVFQQFISSSSEASSQSDHCSCRLRLNACLPGLDEVLFLMQIYIFEGLGGNFSSLGGQHHSPQRYAFKEDSIKKSLYHIIMIAMSTYVLMWTSCMLVNAHVSTVHSSFQRRTGCVATDTAHQTERSTCMHISQSREPYTSCATRSGHVQCAGSIACTEISMGVIFPENEHAGC